VCVCMYVGKYVTFKFIFICRHCACHTVMTVMTRQPRWGGKGIRMWPWSSTDFARACTAYKTLKLFFYAYSIAECDEHELWIGTICLKCKVLK
jgi:hypothetical protein